MKVGTDMPKWQEQSLFPKASGFQWQSHLTITPDGEKLIHEQRIMAIPTWRQLAHGVDYKHRSANGLHSAIVDIWDAVKDLEEHHGLVLPTFEDWDPGVPF